MKATIFINPKTALAAGINNQGDYTIDFDPADLTQAQRDELAHCHIEDGIFITYRDANTSVLDKGVSSGITIPDVAGLCAVLDNRIAARAKRIEADAERKRKRIVEFDAKIDKWIALPLYDGTTRGRVRSDTRNFREGTTYKVDLPYLDDCYDHYLSVRPDFRKAVAEAEAEAERMTVDSHRKAAIRQKNEKAEAEAKAKAEAEAAERRTVQLAAWVSEYGTDNQRGRMAEGMLPESEIIDCIRDQVFAPLAGESRYRKLTVGEVREACTSESEYGDPHEIDFQVLDKKELTADEFDYLAALRERMPDAIITVRSHNGFCTEDDCEAYIFRTSYRVEIKVGELTLVREYGHPDDAQ